MRGLLWGLEEGDNGTAMGVTNDRVWVKVRAQMLLQTKVQPRREFQFDRMTRTRSQGKRQELVWTPRFLPSCCPVLP